jgi:pimeloyl-ACP methyl ester carboxylesterase
VTSTRFAEPLSAGISGSEVVIFEDASHAPIYEQVEDFNTRTLTFLQAH